MAEFQFDCPQCRQPIAADDSMRGLVVSCPHCEKGIVIPKAIQNSVQRRRIIGVNESAAKSKCEGRDVAYDPNFLAIQRRMKEQEEGARAASERIKQIRATNRRREVFAKTAYVLIAVVVCTVGFFLLKGWRDGRAREAAMKQAAIEAQQRIDEEMRTKEIAVRNEESAKRKEEEGKRRQEMEARRKADAEERERRRAEEAKRRAEEERIQQERTAAEKAKYQLQEARRKKYDAMIASLSGLPTGLWRNLKKERRTNVLRGDFYCLVPNSDVGMILYEVSPETVSTLSQEGESESVPRDAYEAVIVERGCLLVADGKVYIISPKTDGDGLLPIPQAPANLAKLLLRGVCDAINRSQVNADSIFFDVTYVSADRKMSVPVRGVSFGQLINRQEILDAVTQHALKSFRPPKQGAKRKRRTVVMYDGPTVRRMADGVTYVPRNPPRGAGKSYQSLCEEARRQEDAEEESRRSADTSLQEARERFCRQIDEALDSGRIKVTVSSR